ncbi:MAG TPA: DUF4091 domain-containing protein [Acidobacteriota bacterium]|nr:DUF4091 domain-containing protein [Acidobacteriota bacterium]
MLRLLFTAILVAPLTVVLCGAEDKVKVWAVPSIQKVRPEAPVEAANLVWDARAKTVKVAGARNEHVPFQLVISTEPPANRYLKPADGFWVEVTELRSSDNQIPGERVDLFFEHAILCYGKSSPVGDTGFWPDALAPLTEPFGMGAAFRKAVRNRAIWVDIHVPDSVPAGHYEAKILVSQDGRQLDELQLNLEVYDFSLPEETHMLAYIGVSGNWLSPAHSVEPGSKEAQTLLKRYYDFLYSHRMEPWFNRLLQPEIEVKDGRVELRFDDELYQRYMVELKTKRVVLEAVPGELTNGQTFGELSAEARARVGDYVKQVVAYFTQHNWAERLVLNSPIDEPNTAEHYEETRMWADIVHDIAPNIPFLVTESPVADRPEWGNLTGHANNFSVHGNRLNDPAVRRAIDRERGRGGEVTWYISCDQVFPQPNYFIDGPAIDPVMVPWITWRHSMNGILYWAVNFWRQTPNPWEDPVTYLSGFLCSEGGILNGEGSLLYPGNHVKQYTGQQNVEGPVSSIRFELLREGIEDYEYLWLLKSLGAADLADRLVSEMVVDVRAFSRNVPAHFEIRERMARKIEELIRDNP